MKDTGHMLQNWRSGLQSRLLPIYLCVVFLTGGASRGDALSLIILRPLAVLFCFAGFVQLGRAQLRPYRAIAGLGAAALALIALHLIPLPPTIWQSLPGRSIITELDAAVGQSGLWRPFTLSPAGGWNALYSMLIPAAGFVLVIQLDPISRVKVLDLVIGLGMASALLGLLQIASSSDGSFYLYSVTNKGSAVGLFANRNHQAVLLAMLLPMLAARAAIAPAVSSTPARTRWVLLGCASLLPPLLLVTGSRLGLFCGGLGGIMALGTYQLCQVSAPQRRTGRAPIPRSWQLFGMAGGFLVLAGVTALLARAEAIRRLLATDLESDLRLRVWEPIWNQSFDFFPLGSGIGSFVPVYQLGESRDNLQLTYLNHAHNDWLELWLTAGLPGLVLLALALVWFLRNAITSAMQFKRRSALPIEYALAITGICCLILMMVGSVGDYPLRTPILAVLLPVMMVFMQHRPISEHGRLSEPAIPGTEPRKKR